VLAEHDGPVEALAFSPDGKLLSTGRDDRTVKLWNVADGKEIATLKAPGQAGKIRCLTFSPDGSLLATGGEQPVMLWDVARRSLLLVLDGPSKALGIAFSPDGRTLAFGGADRAVKLWRIAGSAKPRPTSQSEPTDGAARG
jgi:WD40 repeat protein